MAFLRLLTLLGWTVVFVVLLLFAVKNTEPVTLRFHFDQAWHAPLVFVVLVSVAAGAVLGVIACLAPLLRQRRENVRLRTELGHRERERAALANPPQPATVPDEPSLP